MLTLDLTYNRESHGKIIVDHLIIEDVDIDVLISQSPFFKNEFDGSFQQKNKTNYSIDLTNPLKHPLREREIKFVFDFVLGRVDVTPKPIDHKIKRIVFDTDFTDPDFVEKKNWSHSSVLFNKVRMHNMHAVYYLAQYFMFDSVISYIINEYSNKTYKQNSLDFCVISSKKIKVKEAVDSVLYDYFCKYYDGIFLGFKLSGQIKRLKKFMRSDRASSDLSDFTFKGNLLHSWTEIYEMHKTIGIGMKDMHSFMPEEITYIPIENKSVLNPTTLKKGDRIFCSFEQMVERFHLLTKDLFRDFDWNGKYIVGYGLLDIMFGRTPVQIEILITNLSHLFQLWDLFVKFNPIYHINLTSIYVYIKGLDVPIAINFDLKDRCNLLFRANLQTIEAQLGQLRLFETMTYAPHKYDSPIDLKHYVDRNFQIVRTDDSTILFTCANMIPDVTRHTALFKHIKSDQFNPHKLVEVLNTQLHHSDKIWYVGDSVGKFIETFVRASYDYIPGIFKCAIAQSDLCNIDDIPGGSFFTIKEGIIAVDDLIGSFLDVNTKSGSDSSDDDVDIISLSKKMRKIFERKIGSDITDVYVAHPSFIPYESFKNMICTFQFGIRNGSELIILVRKLEDCLLSYKDLEITYKKI